MKQGSATLRSMSGQQPKPFNSLPELRRLSAAHRQAWAEEVRAAMAEMGLPLYRVAQEAGIAPGTLQSWLDRGVDPDPRAMPALGAVIGRDPLYLMQKVGFLPERLADEGLYFAACCEIRAALQQAAELIHTATALAARLELVCPTEIGGTRLTP